jgi:hypothetical protein
MVTSTPLVMTLVLKVPWVARCLPLMIRRPKMISMVSGRPRSRLSVTSASKNARAWRGWVNTMVRDTSTWAMDSSHQYPACWSAAPSGSGRWDSQRWKNTLMVPGCSASQIRCRTAASSAQANPLDSSVKANPILRACCLAHSWPLTQIFIGQGQYVQTLMNAGPKLASHR